MNLGCILELKSGKVSPEEWKQQKLWDEREKGSNPAFCNLGKLFNPPEIPFLTWKTVTIFTLMRCYGD